MTLVLGEECMYAQTKVENDAHNAQGIGSNFVIVNQNGQLTCERQWKRTLELDKIHMIRYRNMQFSIGPFLSWNKLGWLCFPVVVRFWTDGYHRNDESERGTSGQLS